MAARLGLGVLATAATSILVAVSPAAAQSAKHVGWSEHYRYHGAAAMSFEVTSISIGTNSWTAHISFRNLSKKAVAINGNSFGIAYYKSSTLTPTTKPDAFGVANKFSHPTPVRLAPGAAWSGDITGAGRPALKGKTWARIVFGPFTGVPSNLKVFVWITDHSLPLTFGKKSGTGGLVI